MGSNVANEALKEPIPEMVWSEPNKLTCGDTSYTLRKSPSGRGWIIVFSAPEMSEAIVGNAGTNQEATTKAMDLMSAYHMGLRLAREGTRKKIEELMKKQWEDGKERSAEAFRKAAVATGPKIAKGRV